MRERKIVIFKLLAVLTFAGCTKPDRSEEADRVTDEVKELMFKNPEQALARIDSAEQTGVFSASDANLLRVNIYWNIGQKRMAAYTREQLLGYDLFWDRVRRDKDMADELREVKEQLKQKDIDTALEMKAKGYAVEDIAEITDLTTEQIEAL